MSQEPLRKPIVACALGRLYNKDTVIEKLLDKTTKPETISHIKRLKVSFIRMKTFHSLTLYNSILHLQDIKDLKLTENPSYKREDEKGDNHVDHQAAPYICPISGLEMSGKFKFCLIWTCGCVLSERALKQFNEKLCLKCQKPYTDDDIVILNAADQDLELMISRNKLRQKSKSDKKVKVKIEPNDEPEASTSAVKVKENPAIKKESDVKQEIPAAQVAKPSSNLKKFLSS